METDTPHSKPASRLSLTTFAALAAAAAFAGATAATLPATARAANAATVRTWVVAYRSHTGAMRSAYVLLPSWYGPRRHPALPLVISPHGRGVTGAANAKLWGNLPALGGFAVVNPDGQGDHLQRFSWGSPGQIDDLARMPRIVTAALPWLRIDLRRVYALGGSMGGQETLLLVARHPEVLAGAVAVDSLVDFGRQYGNFGRLSCDASCQKAWGGPLGNVLRSLARQEVGGSPLQAPAAYASRSPIAYAGVIAKSSVRLQIWWSRTDRIVVDSSLQSGLLYRRIHAANPAAPVSQVVGNWAHTVAMESDARLPQMLAFLGLMPGTHPAETTA